MSKNSNVFEQDQRIADFAGTILRPSSRSFKKDFVGVLANLPDEIWQALENQDDAAWGSLRALVEKNTEKGSIQ